MWKTANNRGYKITLKKDFMGFLSPVFDIIVFKRVWRSRVVKFEKFHPLSVTGSRRFKSLRFVYSNSRKRSMMGGMFDSPGLVFVGRIASKFLYLPLKKGWSFLCVNFGKDWLDIFHLIIEKSRKSFRFVIETSTMILHTICNVLQIKCSSFPWRLRD